MLGIADAQRPIDVVVHQVERPLRRARAPVVFRDDRLADSAEHLRIDGGSGGIERRVEAEQARGRELRREIFQRRQKTICARAGNGDARRAEHLEVVRVIPGGERVDDAIARVDYGAVDRVDERPRPTGDEDRLDRVFQSELTLVVALHRLAELGHTVGRRVVRFAVFERGRDCRRGVARESETVWDRSRRP